ncbi:MAG: glucose-6-phosphate dehydrogenase assembly protein OpcA [Planctomycetes bacterium]|nr:glucose-6-phosphate dehydrogenase assembly protein OpcA [Planctomycetota bacterium]
MTATSQPVLIHTPPRATRIDRIHDALHDLWREVASDEGEGGVARALTINFVAVVRAEDEGALRLAADRLTQRSPARAFLVTLDNDLHAPAAEVAAVTRCSGSSRDTVLEEVRLRLPRSWFQHVPGLIRPMLIHDLPNHLYWADDWAESGGLDEVCDLCEHVIVDSRRFSLPAVQLPRLATRREQGARFTDLSWLRLRPWRRALAEAFERVTWQPDPGLRGVVRHGRDATAGAILLAEWLAARLGANIALEESGCRGAACPESVSLHGAGYDIEVTTADQFAIVKVTTAAACHLPFRLPLSKGTDGDLLAAAIDIA